MRSRSVLVLFLLALGLVLAAAAWAGDEAKGKTHEVNAVVVSIDMQAHTITFKGPDGKENTAPVLESAQESLGKVKAGDKVKLTCKDTAEGKHEGISKIKMDKSA